jgi:hypothetical protein
METFRTNNIRLCYAAAAAAAAWLLRNLCATLYNKYRGEKVFTMPPLCRLKRRDALSTVSCVYILLLLIARALEVV